MFAYLQKFLSKYFLISITIITTLISFIAGDLLYNSVGSPDYIRYSSYFKYFFGLQDSSGLEQGLLYYYLNAFSLSLRNSDYNNYFLPELISQSIQITNFFIYVLGLFGLYLFLVNKQIKKNHVMILILLLNFFPPMIALRLIFKPEILIFTLFVWLLFGIEFYLKSRNIYFLIFSSIIIALIVTTKASGAIIVIFSILFLYWNEIIKLGFKKLFTLSTFTLIIFLILSYENYQSNGLLVTQHQTTINYYNTADLSFIYSFDVNSLLNQPVRHSQNNSLLGFLLIETFDDYLTIYWNNDTSLFYQNRISFINPYLRQYFSIALTTTFYVYLIFVLFTKYKYKKFVFLPFIGISTMAFVSLFIQFDPSTGDMMKNYYYSFLLTISFCFLIIHFYEKCNYFISVSATTFYILCIVFIVGFPKFSNENFQHKINQNLSSTYYCKIYDFFTEENDNCGIKTSDFCEFHFGKKDKIIIENGKLVEKKFTPLNFHILSKSNQSYLNIYDDCVKYSQSREFGDSDIFTIRHTPIINLFCLLSIILFVLFNLIFVKSPKISNKSYKWDFH